ncbi:MAG: 4Fe-4S binding protein [Methanobacteriaceae archaeon]|nr:4Fe-4S binding protein [Methanobacteriaceae archaeon]
MVVSIDFNKCNGVAECPGAGLCIQVCALEAMSEVDDKPSVSDDCTDCGLCVMNCPNEAITKPE